MQIQVIASDANNILCQVTPPAVQTITIDRGVAGNGIVSIVPVTIATFQYLRITYTNGTVSDVGPLTSTAYTATAPINITGNTISLLTVPIANGGTGQTTANAAFNALVPAQTGNSGKYLTTDGTNTSWATNPLGTVTSVSGAGTVSGLTLTGTVTTSGSLTLGGTLNLSAYNGAGAFTTLSASSSVTLSGGTANGVAYLNGSKVLTTGSALVFDGTNLGIGTSSPSSYGGLVVKGNTTALALVNDNFINIDYRSYRNAQLHTINYAYAYRGTESSPVTLNDGDVIYRIQANGYDGTSTLATAHIDLFVNGAVSTGVVPGALRFFTGSNGSPSERLRITSTGNVGIGTSSPGGALDVVRSGEVKVSFNSNTAGSEMVQQGGGGAGARHVFAASGQTPYVNSFDILQSSGGAASLQNRANQPMTFLTNDTERMRITAAGDVGIGTNSPGGKVDILGSTDVYALKVSDGTRSGGFIPSASGGLAIYTPDTTPLSFWTNNAERARIDASGNLLVGGTASNFGKVSSVINFGNNFATSFGARALGTAQGQLAGYTFFPTFQGTGDNTARRAADIWSGFNLGAWGAEFLAFGVGNNGSNNDAGNVSSEKMRITGAGNVGIGTSSPTTRLHVAGDSVTELRVTSSGNLATGSAALIRFGGSNSATSGYFGYGGSASTIDVWNTLAGSLTFGTSNLERARIDSAGNLLVGTTSASGKLTVLGASGRTSELDGATIRIRIAASEGGWINSYSFLANNGTELGAMTAGGSSQSITYLGWNVAGSERARINSSGNFGIATTSPVARLDINNQDAANTLPLVVSNNIGGIDVATAGIGFNAHTVNFAQIVGGQHENGSFANGNLRFFTRNAEVVSEKMRLTTTGDLLLTQTRSYGQSANIYLEIGGTDNGFVDSGRTSSWRQYVAGDANGQSLRFDGFVRGTGWTERARIDSSGNLLVGTTVTSQSSGPGTKVISDAAGAFVSVVTTSSTTAQNSYSYYSTGAGAYRFYVAANGQIYATNTSITSLSDISLKENVRDLETGLAEVMSLRPRRFDWKNGDAQNVAGFVAQEVAQVLPDLVSEYQYTDGVTKKSLKMGDMLPTLVKAIQELKAEFDAYKATHP